jgi:potassium efflux system protein
VKQVCRDGGLAIAHFGHEPAQIIAIRRGVGWLQWIGIPCVGLVVLADALGDELLIASVGRGALIVALSTLTLILWSWLGPKSPLSLAHRGGIFRLRATRRVIAVGLFLIPIALIGATSGGYHYAAVQLGSRVVATLAIVTILLIARGLALRWLLIAYRRAAIRSNQERREALALARESVGHAESDLPKMIEVGTAGELSHINEQAKQLLGLVVALVAAIGLFLVWHEFLPALQVVFGRELWINSLATTGTAGEPVWVTAGDLLLAVAILGMTVVACKNLPSLLEISLLQHLRWDAGARYAAQTLTRYILAIVGVIAAGYQLGIGWSSIQWLVAAMTVGLGFGLQEIFANFVSGIILLFERPVRIGDTVTINDVTGTVTRIQIRATTILDWDNKELIVPNKEFVTGNLVNWTLSSQSLRLVLKVGIAYGTDTRLATSLLYKIAAESTDVLKDPEPIVVFTEFGDSSLNFELRLFVAGTTAYRKARHELNLAINDTFRQHKIEIAFPQRDVHIRTLAAPLPPDPSKSTSPDRPERSPDKAN